MVGLSSLQFRHPFRKYQRQILDQVETSKPAERKHHIVAPPGSGKTIVGLELIRRFGKPAVVFAPTATIQQQWCEEVGLFTEAPTSDLVSREPERIAPINIYTYQLISAPAESRELLRETALKMWLEELLKQEGDSDLRPKVLALAEVCCFVYARSFEEKLKAVEDGVLKC